MGTSANNVSFFVRATHGADNILPFVGQLALLLEDRRAELVYIVSDDDASVVDAIVDAHQTLSSGTFSIASTIRATDHLQDDRVISDIQRSRYDHVVFVPSDSIACIETIADLIEESDHMDLVVASRFRNDDEEHTSVQRTRMQWTKYIISKILFPSKLRGITDPTSSFFVIDRTHVTAEKLRTDSPHALLEILATHQGPTRAEIASSVEGYEQNSLQAVLRYIAILFALKLRTALGITRRPAIKQRPRTQATKALFAADTIVKLTPVTLPARIVRACTRTMQVGTIFTTLALAVVSMFPAPTIAILLYAILALIALLIRIVRHTHPHHDKRHFNSRHKPLSAHTAST